MARGTTGADPRDGPRTNYIGDDSLNPGMRQSVNALINKINKLNTMQDPENRAEVIKRLSVDLPPYELATVISWMLSGWAYQLRHIPYLEPSILSGSSFETVFEERITDLSHRMDPLPSRKHAGKFLNRCRICGKNKNFPFHDIQ